MPDQTFWSTKYLLTQGIQRLDDCVESRGYATRSPGRSLAPDYVFQKIGTDAFPTEALARERARTIVAKKLRALDREREKLLQLQSALG